MGLNILYHGDSPTVDTGFGIVARNILKRLYEKGHKITVLGINHYGEPYDHNEFPYQIYPCDKGGRNEVFGIGKFWWLESKIKPDIIFWLNDPWIISDLLDAKPKDYETKAKSLAYFPTDSGPLKPAWAKQLSEKVDTQIAYTHYAEEIIEQANGKYPDNLRQIYHGVDTSVFKPLNQSLARAELGLPQDAFIVGMVARNQYRKRFDILVKAFAKFAEDKPNAKLYLHTALHDIGYDIGDLADQFKLRDKLILTEDLSPAHGVPIEYLNKIYNTFDVNCLISLGDGFGLPVAESMATSCPQVVSDHSALKELVEDGKAGLTVKNSTWLLNISGLNTWGGVSDVDDIVDKLNIFYYDRELRLKCAENGYKYIHQDKFNWDHIVNQFDREIKDLYHIYDPRKEKTDGITA